MSRYIMRTILALLFLAISIPAYSQVDQPAQYPDYSGIWETSLGRMALWQARDAVWGFFGTDGEIGGHIKEDGVLHFYYSQAGDVGMGWLETSDDDLSFEGFYASTLATSIADSWEGTFLGPNEFEIGDRDVLTAELNPNAGPPVEETTPETPEIIPTTPENPPMENEPESTVITEPEAAPVASSEAIAAWSGTWDTQRGYVVLAAESTGIFGSLGESGVITGTIDGESLSIHWSITDEAGNITEGDALFTLSEDGLSFRGTYNSTTNPNLWLPWFGIKVTEPEAEEETE